MCESESSNWNKKDSFKIAFESMNREISLFWTRSNYFLLLNTAIFTGLLLNVYDVAIGNIVVSKVLSFIGLMVSLLWLLTNASSRFWILRWEIKLKKIEGDIEDDISETLGLYNICVKDQKKEVKDFIEGTKRKRQEKVNEIKNIFKKQGGKLLVIFRNPIDWLIKIKPPVTEIAIYLSLASSILWLIAFINCVK